MQIDFDETNCTKLQFLLDVVFRNERVYLKFINERLQLKHLVIEKGDVGIYLVINNENIVENDNGCGGNVNDGENEKVIFGIENKIAKLSTILKYAFPEYSFEFQNIGISIYAIDRDLYDLILKNSPNYCHGILYKLKITIAKGAIENENAIVNWNERRAVLKCLLNNSSCLNDLYAVSSIIDKHEQVFIYNILLKNIREYHEDNENNDNDGDDDDEDDRQNYGIRGLFTVGPQLRIDDERTIHALDVPLEKRCHYWSYWTGDGFPYRDPKEYFNKRTLENPLSHISTCMISVSGGKPQSNEVYLTPIDTIVVFTTAPNNVRFMWVYTTMTATKETREKLSEWENVFYDLYGRQEGSRFSYEFFQDEDVLLSRFVLELAGLCFIPFSVTFHFLSGYDIYFDVYRPIMGRLMDLRLFDIVQHLSVDIFENLITFNNQYLTCDLKQPLSLVCPSKSFDDLCDLHNDELLRFSQRTIERLRELTIGQNDAIRRLSRTIVSAVVWERLWIRLEFDKSMFFITGLLNSSVRDMFGCSKQQTSLTRKISKRLEYLIHNDSLEIGRYVSLPRQRSVIDNFHKMGLSCVSSDSNNDDGDNGDIVISKNSLSEPPLLRSNDKPPITDSRTFVREARGLWKKEDEKRKNNIYVHVKIANATAQICSAYNVSFENAAIIDVAQFLSAAGIVLVNDLDDNQQRDTLRVIDAASKYVRCNLPSDCHQLFEAIFTRDDKRKEYTIDGQNVRLFYYDGYVSIDYSNNKTVSFYDAGNELPGRPITTLDQLLSIKDKEHTRIVVILTSFEGSLPLTVKQNLLNRKNLFVDIGYANASDRLKNAFIDVTIDALFDNVLRDKVYSVHSPICASVIDVLQKGAMYNLFDAMYELVEKRTDVNILIVNKDEVVWQIPEHLEESVRIRLQTTFDRISSANGSKGTITLTVAAKYDGILIINASSFVTFENVRNRNNEDETFLSPSSYRIQIHGNLCNIGDETKTPPAIATAIKYICDWVYFDELNSNEIYAGLVDLFTAIYVFLFSQEQQEQFSIAVKRTDFITEAENCGECSKVDSDEETLEDKSCNEAVRKYIETLKTERRFFDGVIWPLVVTPLSMGPNDSVDVNKFIFKFNSRDTVHQISERLVNKVVVINYYFFLKRCRKLLYGILDKHRGVFDRFVKREETKRIKNKTGNNSKQKNKNDVKPYKDIIDSISQEAFIKTLRGRKNGDTFDKVKRIHQLLFQL